ncbi:MAG: Nif3-like dinuclear metal center hexameric protein [Planctomycetaceae bacterium]
MPSLPLDAVLQKLSEIAPLRLAESWDNVGLLVGDRRADVHRVMTCLTITPEVVQESIERNVGLLVVHHPLPFKPLTRITSDSTTGQMLLALIAARVAVYSAHTAFDSAAQGINATWAEMLNLQAPRALEPAEPEDESIGSGRFGRLDAPTPLDTFATFVAELVGAGQCRLVPATGPSPPIVTKVAIACGSGGAMLAAAKRRGCDAMVTGEATFHTCLEAQASGIHLILVGHYHSERFAMVRLAAQLAAEWNDIEVFASDRDLNPLQEHAAVPAKH